MKEYILGSTAIITVNFKNRENQLADLESLTMTGYLEKDVKIMGETVIDLLVSRKSPGTYEILYDIPTDIDLDVYKSVTIVFEGKRGNITQKTAVTLPVGWRGIP